MNLETYKRNYAGIDIHEKRKKRVKKYQNDDTDEENEENDEEIDPSKIKDLLKSGMGGLFAREEDNIKGKNNHIYFDDDINKQTCRKLIGKIDELNIKLGKLECEYEMEQPFKIYLHINSFGGSVFSAFNVIDAMRRSKYPIVTIIEGASASAATLISVCGHERWITQHGYMLIHQLSSGCWGKFTEIQDEYDNLKEITKHIYSIYDDKTNMTKKQLVKLLKHDRWWNAETCLEKGLVDKII